MNNQQLLKFKNPVLIKDQQGKVRQTTYDLPGENHAYGKKVQDDPEPMKRVVNGWQTASQAAELPSQQKNYKQLNKLATKTGLHTAKQQTQLRKTNDIMVQTKKGQKVIPIMLPQQNFTYGVQNRPSTPIKLVVGNCYALEQDQKNETMYQQQSNKARGNKTVSSVSSKTKSQVLREQKAAKTKQYRNGPLFEEKFKMGKFTNSGAPKIDTNIKPFLSAAQNVLSNSGTQNAQQTSQQSKHLNQA